METTRPLGYEVTDEVMNSMHMKDHLKGKEDQVILPQHAIATLFKESKGDALITTGVGQHQMWAGQHYVYKHPRQLITSAGLGAMGFGYPAALGVKVAHPNKEVIDIDGDGSFLMNIQELATAKIEKINAKALVLNNQHLGMVVQWEDRFYKGNRGHTYRATRTTPRQFTPITRHVRRLRRKCERVMYKGSPCRYAPHARGQGTLRAGSDHPLHRARAPFIPAGHTVADMIY